MCDQVGLVDMLYRKALKVGCSARSEFGIGSIVNLQSNDAAKLWNLAQYLHMLWSAPFQVLVSFATVGQHCEELRVLTVRCAASA